MAISPPAIQRPFRTTHIRNDGQVSAHLVADCDGVAIYRVAFADGPREVERNTACSSASFHRRFTATATFR